MRALVATWGNDVWPWFLIVVTLTFIGFEGYALFTNTANTLSDYIWRELHVRPLEPFNRHNAAWLLTQGVYVTIAFWLWLHLWYHQFT
jgi:hypothetical protein